MVQAIHLIEAWYEVHMVLILLSVFPTHCLLSGMYVNSITNQSLYAAHNICDGTNRDLGRARGARTEKPKS